MITKLLAVLLSYLPERLWWALCARLRGHGYSTNVLHHEDLWVIDPNSLCRHCGKPMSDDVYEAITDAYAIALAADMLEDEAW
jgi:hypothetical protein